MILKPRKIEAHIFLEVWCVMVTDFPKYYGRFGHSKIVGLYSIFCTMAVSVNTLHGTLMGSFNPITLSLNDDHCVEKTEIHIYTLARHEIITFPWSLITKVRRTFSLHSEVYLTNDEKPGVQL